MRFHVVALPQTQTTRAFSACPFTQKVRGFCRMMKALGHEVFLYGGESNDVPCDELVTCFTEGERKAFVGSNHYAAVSFDETLPQWRSFNANAIRGITARAQPQDFVCIIAGSAHKAIADALPNLITVEFGIGYGGSFAKYRVFESYAWMHTCYGAEAGRPGAADGRWFDAVIPGYLDVEEFPCPDAGQREDDYLLFVGRLIERKGYLIAAEVCQKLGKRLILAGNGTPPPGVEHVGVVGPEQRGNLMAGARALFAPTIYVEPFGNVAIEAMACGTPVITTDWGAFTETVIDGVTGFRCRSFTEFCTAAERAPSLDRRAIRDHVVQNYALEAIGRKYNAYFERLSTLWGAGWYAEP